ncbi:beta strand repeat-containing protein [Methanobacterium aggregans]|uniref:beta strand repeat-containing protein n=1 Tax=Methanobacterium aggregans TaxID=1615586 RepID=UPI001AE819CF|nr:right-handed parallel beta-helix repeat-containing protein [Methanobacterium aggregans]MBP2044999.1 putative outer membrane repeat protein [Methanobacterium aggregans]
MFSFGVSAVSAAGTDNSTIYVNTQGDDTWDGLSPVYNTTSGPKKTITNATGTVAVNGTVHIAQGTYNESGININQNMTITGENQDNTIINGQQSGNSIFYVGPGITVTITNLTLRNSTAFNGGAIYNQGNLTVTNCTLTGNTATNYGGAIYNEGSLTVTNSTLTGNTASNGGAITNMNGNLTVTSTIINNNVANDGGAISNYGNLTVTNSLINNNSAASYGGAIENYGTLTLTKSTLTGNSASSSGGAIFNAMMGTSTVTNCTLTGNSASFTGGAIFNGGGSSVTVTNSTLTGNTATNYGGAIYTYGDVRVTNCTLKNNTARNNGGAICNDGGNVTVTNSTLSKNNATNGGAIFNSYYLTLTVTNCTLAGNSATNGGAIYNRNYQVTVVSFSSIVNNTASLGSAIYNEYGVIDAKYNWWGSNDPVWANLIYQMSNPINWLYMTINTTPTIINNTQSSLVTVSFNNVCDGTTFTSFDPSTGHILDGTLVTYSSTLGSFNPATATTVNGIATSIFTAKHGGTGNLNATTDNQTVMQLLTVNPVSYLYLNTTTSKKNPTAGETFILTYKLGNSGPDAASNVTITIPVPENFEISKISGDGSWIYNETMRTITWTLVNVPKGDPYLYITGKTTRAGVYSFGSSITSDTYNINTEGVTPLTINAASSTNTNSTTDNTASVNAASNTVTMQNTGMPIAGLVLAILAVLGGMFTPRKK